jgi:hypothetical protein
VVRDEILVLGTGQATLTGKLQDFPIPGAASVTGYDPPTTAADPPTLPAQNVISMFSDVYDDVPVDTWRTDWSDARLEDYVVAGDNTKMYSAFVFAGIEFMNPMIDASGMDYLHLDVYAPKGTSFGVNVVSFPPDLSGSVEARLTFNAETQPAFNPGGWASLEIPLTQYELPEGFDWRYIGQLVLSTTAGATGASLVLVDNVYWHK